MPPEPRGWSQTALVEDRLFKSTVYGEARYEKYCRGCGFAFQVTVSLRSPAAEREKNELTLRLARDCICPDKADERAAILAWFEAIVAEERAQQERQREQQRLERLQEQAERLERSRQRAFSATPVPLQEAPPKPALPPPPPPATEEEVQARARARERAASRARFRGILDD